uniref:tRNA pseudouridine synthase n=1 Tax=Strongyloides stercoralis TaxID=6248 RepID=A0A0K0DW70_STRER
MSLRYLLRVSYDGSRYPEMAKGNTKIGVVDLLEKIISYSLSNDYSLRARCFPSSRTDAGVHAINNAIMVQVPLENDLSCNKKDFLKKWNFLIDSINPNSMKVLDFNEVVHGFSNRHHVSYRIYTYRLAIAKNFEIYENFKNSPSIVCMSEMNYSWILPPGFDTGKAQEACNMFKGCHNFASYYKHPERQRRKEISGNKPFQNTERNILLANVGIGKEKVFENDLYDYVNISIVSRSFIREQIRRMLSIIVAYSYGRIKMSTIKYLFDNPKPSNFYDMKIHVAPPNGLFLTDVVYDPQMYLKPIPHYTTMLDFYKWKNELNSWTYEDSDGETHFF